MRLLIILIFSISALVLAYCVKQTFRFKNDLSTVIRRLLIFACMAVVTEEIAILMKSTRVSNIFFLLSLLTFNGTILYFTKYAYVYTGYHKFGRILFYITWAGSVYDSLMLTLNMNSGRFYQTRVYMLSDRSILHYISKTPAFSLRWFFVILLVSLCLCLFMYMAITAPYIYRTKYICIVASVMVPLGLFAAGYLMKLKIDVTSLTFAIAGSTLFYFSLIYSPREILASAHSRVISGLEDPVVTLDQESRYIDMNEAAAHFFRVEQKDKYPALAETAVQNWLSRNNVSMEDNYGSVNIIDYESDGKTPVYINVKTQVIYDEKGGRVGYFLQIHDYTVQEKRRQSNWYAATHDSLTGLLNRSAFLEYARATLEDYPNRDYVIVCSDIENFKLVNDIFGENYGDDMLKRLSVLLNDRIKGDEYLGRLGSDIFAFIIEKKNLNPENLIQVSKDLIPDDMRLSLQVHIQFGVYDIIERESSVNVMCERALIAIKNVKGRLEDAVVYYDDKLRADTLEEQELISEIEPAIDKGQFVFFLQPQVNSDGKILGGEALVRWRHPEKGLVPPGKFIGILEKKGLIPKLDRCIWEQACAKLREWKDIGRDDLYISVNISPRDFYYLDVYKTFVDLVDKYGIDSKNLRLEITETAVMQNLNEQIRLIENLRNARFVVEMDDFGSGYSSLNTLKDIHMDILKIDMGFLGDGIGNERSRTILEIVVDLAKRLNMPTVIEGVEHAEEVEFLKTIGCNVFQGYYFAKPMEVSTFEAEYMNISPNKEVTA